MAVHIRLKRVGKNPKKNPHFRIAVFHDTRGRDGRFIEELGFYNPRNNLIKLKKQRLEYWLKNGAQLSLTVKSIAKKAGEDATQDKK